MIDELRNAFDEWQLDDDPDIVPQLLALMRAVARLVDEAGTHLDS